MIGLSFFSKVISNVNTDSLKGTVALIQKRSGKSKLYLYFDIIWCAIVYGAGYNDYRFYKFETLNRKQRKTFITRSINNKIVKKLNNSEYKAFLSNKVTFYKRFSAYTKRGFADMRICSFGKFEKFIQGKEYIIAKSASGSCGKEIEKFCVADFGSIKELYDMLKSKGYDLAEDCVVQHREISKIYPCSVNTLRIVTINYNNTQTVVYAMIRIGNHGAYVDNLNSGGMCAPIDIESGTIYAPAYDKEEKTYIAHPYTGERIVGFQIPFWKQAVSLCLLAAKEIPQVGYIGWDVCVTDDTVLLIEGNEYPGHDIIQLPPHLGAGKTGMLPRFKQLIPNL